MYRRNGDMAEYIPNPKKPTWSPVGDKKIRKFENQKHRMRARTPKRKG